MVEKKMYEGISLNNESKKYLVELLEHPQKYQINIEKVNDATILDCGIHAKGSIAAGMLFVKISLGGLADVKINQVMNSEEKDVLSIQVTTSFPVLATLGCQAASWNISVGNFFGMACGPGRAIAQKPSKIYKTINYKDESEIAILCIESSSLPNEEVISYLVEKCNVKKDNLYLLMISTNCLVEYIQMAARAIEIGVFRLVEQLGYPKEQILHAVGSGIIASLSDKVDESNDRVNNALIYGTKLHLIVQSEQEAELSEKVKYLPSSSSKNYGRKFLELFNEAGRDFANFDLSLLAPTEISINNIVSGKTYRCGKMNLSLIFN